MPGRFEIPRGNKIASYMHGQTTELEEVTAASRSAAVALSLRRPDCETDRASRLPGIPDRGLRPGWNALRLSRYGRHPVGGEVRGSKRHLACLWAACVGRLRRWLRGRKERHPHGAHLRESWRLCHFYRGPEVAQALRPHGGQTGGPGERHGQQTARRDGCPAQQG